MGRREREECRRGKRLGADPRIDTGLGADALDLGARPPARQRERVRERLAAMREARGDDREDRRPARGELVPALATSKRDERGVDVRDRHEDRARDRVAPDRLEREAAEDARRAVRALAGTREEAIGDLALDQAAPGAHVRQRVDRAQDQGRRDVVRQVRDEGGRLRSERGQVEPHRVTPHELDVRLLVEHLGQRRLELAIDLDRRHVRDLRRQVLGQRSDAGADLEHDVLRPQVGEPIDHLEQVVVEQEVLPELAVRPQAVLREPAERPLPQLLHQTGSANAASALSTTARASSSGSTPRSPAMKRSVSSTIAGRHGRPRCGTGRQVRRVGLDEQALDRDAPGGLLQRRRARVRDVAREARPPAALDHLVELVGQREAVQHHAPLEPAQHGERLARGLARVDDERLPGLRRELDLPLEGTRLHLVRRALAVEVEAALADRNHARIDGQLGELVAQTGVPLLGAVRVQAHGGAQPRVSLAQLERLARQLGRVADADDPLDARLGRRLDRRVRPFRQALQVGVGVDHAATGGDSMRGKSCAAALSTRASGARPPLLADSHATSAGSAPTAASSRAHVPGMTE